MNESVYPLRFTIANRMLFSVNLGVAHINAFGKVTTDDIGDLIPDQWSAHLDGYLLHSVQVNRELPTLQRTEHQIQYVLARYNHYRTDLTGSFDDFLQTKASKTRSTLRRKVRKFAEAGKDGQLDWREYHTPDELESFFALALPLARTTYQARLFEGALPDTAAFRAESQALASSGQLRCYLLFLDQVPVAYLYSPIEDRTAIYAYLGYDESVSMLSPGTVLQYLVHERLFSDPDVDWFDFTEGDGAHKALFATDRLTSCNILCLQDSFRNRMLARLHDLWNRLISQIKQAVAKAS